MDKTQSFKRKRENLYVAGIELYCKGGKLSHHIMHCAQNTINSMSTKIRNKTTVCQDYMSNLLSSII